MEACKVFVLFWALSFSATAQTDRYVVFFKDKNGSPYSISQPQFFLSAKSIARRKLSGVTVKPEDIPVTPVYVTQVRANNAKTFFTSRWMNAVLIEATSVVVATIRSLPFVSSVEFVAPGHKLLGGRVRKCFLQIRQQ